MRLSATRLMAVSNAARRPYTWRQAQAAGAVVVRQWLPDQWAYQQQMLAQFPGDATKCLLYQDSAGTLPVTALEQFVGLAMDFATAGQRAPAILDTPGCHLIQATPTARPRISARVNVLTGTEVLATQSVTTRAATKRLRFDGTGSITLSGTATGTYTAGVHSIACTAGTLTLTVSGSVTQADLRLLANTAQGIPAYQRVTAADDYDAAGFPVSYRFDGVDDSFSSAAPLNLSGTAEVTVLAGVLKASDAATGILIETSTTSSASAGTIRLTAPGDAGANSYAFLSRGSVLPPAANPGAVFPAPHRALVCGSGRISTNRQVLRVNGAQVASNSSNQGTGAYGNFTLFFGARAGTSLRFNGESCGFTLLGRVLTDAQTAALETDARRSWRAW